MDINDTSVLLLLGNFSVLDVLTFSTKNPTIIVFGRDPLHQDGEWDLIKSKEKVHVLCLNPQCLITL